MAQNWRTVRVFISSTFRDMQVERDHLVRVVFPELKERCRKRHVNMIDVDLRWGVTEKQAEGGGALDICLDEIDTCRPYFLGLLGQRYGSIPAGNEHSITADEIFHGVLHNDLPRQVMDLRPFVEGILEGKTLLKEQVRCLVRNYRWDANKRKYLALENIKCSPYITTAWEKPGETSRKIVHRNEKMNIAFGCPYCGTWDEVQHSQVGGETTYPQCKKRVKLNPFTLKGNWQPIAKAWLMGQ